MKKTLATGVLAVCLSAFGAHSAAAQTTLAFMSVPNIPGDSTVLHYENQIELFSVTQSFTPTIKASACSVAVTKGFDRSGPALWAAAVTGQSLGEVKIQILKAGGDMQRFYTLTLTNAFVSSITSTPSSFTESLSLTASAATLSYYPQNPDGSLGAPISSTVSCGK